MEMSVDAQECLLAQVTGVFPVPHHATDDVPAQSLKARDQPFECPGFPVQDFGHQVPVVLHLDLDTGKAPTVATVGAVNVSSVTERRLAPLTTGDRNPMDPAYYFLLALLATIAFSIKTIVDARSRTKLLQSNPQESLVEAILKGEERRRRQSALRWGIVLVFLAVGFGIVEIMEWTRPSPGLIAVLLGTTGLGNITSYLVCRKIVERDSGAA